MSKHRQAKLDALTSNKFIKAVAKHQIKLLDYNTLIEGVELSQMVSPLNSGYGAPRAKPVVPP